MAAETKTCAACGTELPSGTPERLCPQCLLARALEYVAEAANEVGPEALEPRAVLAVPFTGERIRYFGDYKMLEEIARGGIGVGFKIGEHQDQQYSAWT